MALSYRLALRLWDRPTALLAAALLAVSFYHTLDSAFATLDVPMGFLVTLGLLLAARAADAPGPREFAAFGLVLGVLAGTKITGAALVVVPVAMALGAPRAERGRWVAGTALAAAVAVTVFALSTPHVVLHPRAYLEFMAGQRLFYVDRYEHTLPAITLAWLRARWIARTPPVALLALAGSTMGFATTGRAEAWTTHAWRYPVVDTIRHPLVAAQDGPAFLVVTGWTLDPMREALASGRLGPGDVWPDSLASFWYRYQIPALEDFRFYARLVEGRSGYALIGCWRPATPLPPEFSDRSVGLYHRDTLLGASPGSPAARRLAPCPAEATTTCLSRN